MAGIVHSTGMRNVVENATRDVLRRLALIRAGQEVGLPLSEVADALYALPEGRTPTAEDWRQIATGWASKLDARIRVLERLRNDLDGCIGCGCLSMQRCQLINPSDVLAEQGTGAVTLSR